MNQTQFSIAHINALQRADLDTLQSVPVSLLMACPVQPAGLVRIASAPRQDELASHAVRARIAADTLAGIGTGGDADHLVFIASGAGGEIRIAIAVTDKTGRSAPDANLRGILSANLPGVELVTTDLDAVLPQSLTACALVVGTPAPTLPEAPDDPGPLDRLFGGLRDMEGKDSWAWCVVAQRLPWATAGQRLSSVLAELRTVADAERGVQPIAAYYRQLLQSVSEKLTLGRSVGLWSVTAVLGASSEALLTRGSALAQSVFSGEQSRPDPVRTLPLAEAPPLPARFDAPRAEAPGPDLWLGAYTSLLHSTELSAFVTIPRLEQPGFEVRRAPRFKQSIPAVEAVCLPLGEVLDRSVSCGATFRIDPAKLTSHTLVAGASGSGKTNTVFHLLRELARAGTPFLVIEPSKTEYRILLDDPEIGPKLNVYTLGLETIAPFRLNPFEVPDGIAVQTHIDRLKALFNASFTMYAPMPQVLERCLLEIYEERGWNLLTGVNYRGIGADAFPTLGDLYTKIDEVVPKLGYEDKITADVSAALRTRIDSLRVGAKGSMLDTTTATDLGNLLSRPAVLELDAIGDDDEKAFLVGLFFIRLAEQQMLAGPTGGRLRHITVIEEAHRLFLNMPLIAGSEVGNPKGKAVETFCNILSEIRVFGEGVIVVDQIPTRLAPDTLKNTSLKVMHRLPASDDREVLGRTMAQSAEQTEAGVALRVGVALVYVGGQNGSFEIAMPRAPLLGEPIAKADSDRRVAAAMAARRLSSATPAPTPISLRQVQTLRRSYELQEQVIRWIQSIAVSPGAFLDVLMPLIQLIVRLPSRAREAPPPVILRDVLRATLRDFARMAGWPFDESLAAECAMLAAYDDAIGRLLQQQPPSPDANAEFREYWERLNKVDIYPFPNCHLICPDFQCSYRHVARWLAEREPLRTAWVTALKSGHDQALWDALADVAGRAVERGLGETVGPDDRRRFAGCFAQHSLDQDRELEQRLCDKAFRNMMNVVERRLDEGEDRQLDAVNLAEPVHASDSNSTA